MKSSGILLYLLVLGLLACGQNPLIKQWDFRYGGTNRDLITCMQQTVDGGFVLGGFSSSNTGGDKSKDTKGGYDFWVIKVDAAGMKEWDKDFGGAGDDRMYALQQTADGGYLLAGSSNSGQGGDKTQPNWDSINFTADVWIIKLDALGNKMWDKTFGGSESDFAACIQQTTDGGYILGCNSNSSVSGDKTAPNRDPSGITNDFWIIKVDTAGDKVWDKVIGGSNNDALVGIAETANGDYFAGGFSLSGISGDKTQPSKGQLDFWLVKIDAQGLILWDKDYGGSENDIASSMCNTSDGGVVLAGITRTGIDGDKTQPNWDNSNSTYDYWIVKTDAAGTIQWDFDYGGSISEPYLGTVIQTNDGGYLLAGLSYSSVSGNKTENNLGVEQIWAIKTNVTGIVEWDKTVFTTAEDEVAMAIQTTDGCYVMANNTPAGIGGYKSQPARGFEDYWLVKFCDTTLTSLGGNNSAMHGEIEIFPNPVLNELKFVFPPQTDFPIAIKLFDAVGNLLIADKLTHAKATLNVEQLPKGIYILECRIDAKSTFKKIIR